MPTHVYIGYSAEALDIDVAAMTVALRPDFDPMLHRVRIAIKDDDSRLDGDRGADETGDDAGQTAVVRGLDGTLVAAGRIYDELHAVVTGGGQTITGEMLEIDGELVGFLSSAPLVPGVVYRVEATRNVGAPGIGPDDADPWLTTGSAVGAPSYSAYARVPCYVEGTLIRTDWGLRPIEMIGTGDLVETLDAGLQPVLWAGAVAVPLDRLAADPACRPVRIAAHAFGPDCPARDLLVSRQHRLALSSGRSLPRHMP
jgi:hypothetical protein